MFKKHLLLLLLLALIAPWAAFGQATLPIGTGTNYATSGSSAGACAGSPMGNTWYYNSTSQMIFTATELGGAKTINSVAFFHNAYSFNATLKIYLAHTTASTVDASSPAREGTLVYSATGISVGGSSADWQTFAFNTNFSYNGTDNLLVVVCRTNYSNGYSAYQGWQYTETTDNKFMVRSADTDSYGDITNTSNPYTASTKRPNVLIGYVLTTPYITLDPTSTTVLTGFTKTLTATVGNVTGTPDITYTSSNDNVATVSGSGTSATVTGVASGTATITATMNYQGTDYTATCDVVVEDPSYCTPSFSYSSDYINSFTTTGGEQNINNTNSGQGTGGYSNFYDTHFVSAEPATEIGFSVVRGYNDTYNYAIWVDWNKDYVFDNSTNSTEKVAFASSKQDWTGSFTIPAGTPAGDYHMRVLQVYSWTPAPCVSASYGEGEDYKLTVIAGNPYQKPENLQVSTLAATTATITWEAPNSDVQSYKYQYREAGGTWNDLTSTTALSAPLTVLTASTIYDFQVQAIYAGDHESNFASMSFVTPHVIPYVYGFEEGSELDFWDLVNGETNTGVWDNATIEYNFGYEPARTGDYSFMFYYVDYPDTDPEYQTLISPALAGIENGLHVEFYYVGDLSGGGQETFRVGYSTTNKDLNSFIWGDEITNASTEYQRFSANYPAGTKYVAVQHTSDDQYYLFLDDFTFEEAAACLEPTNVTYDNVTTTGADISWNAGGEETAWDIFVTDDATVEPDDETTPTYANVNSNENYPISNLTQATTYYVYVRAICDENSAWSVPAIFHTECEGMPLPYGPYSFEDGALSVCWNVINTNTSYNSVIVVEGNANTGTHSLAFYRGSDTGDLVAVLPEVGAYNLSGYQFEFSTKGAYAGYQITVGIMTDPEDLATFEAQGDMITTTTSYADYKVRFNEYTGTGKYVAIKVVRPSTVTYGYSFVDDIAINPIPSCLEPEDLVVSDETTHGATFAWTAGAATQTAWQLYFSKTNTAPADDETNVTDANSNPFTVESGLDAETDYYVWVRANCGGTDGYSIWVGPETFTTGIACPAPTGLADNNVTNHSADLSWNGTSESYNVMYRTAAYMSNPVLNEEFKTTTLPTDWGRSNTALTENVLNGTTTISSYSGGWFNSSYGLGEYNWKMNIYSTNKFWLITKNITLGNNSTLNFDAAITAYNSNSAPTAAKAPDANSRFVVLITTDNQATWTILREWNNTGSADVLNNISNTGNNFSIDLSDYAGETVKIAFYGGQTVSGPDCDLHIDNVTIGTPVAAGAWQTVNPAPTASPCTITGLLAETKYEAKVQGNCGSEGMSQETTSIFFTTDVACPAPASFQVVEHSLKHNEVSLSWPADATAWQLCVNDATPYINIALTEVSIEEGVATYVLGSLTPETDYSVKLRADCTSADDGYSEWTEDVEFTTLSNCAAPEPLSASEIDYFSATLNWTGLQENYNVQYRTVGTNDLTEDFSGQTPVGYSASDGQLPDGWYSYNSGTTGYAPRVSNRTQYGQSYIVAFGDNNNFLLMTTNATGQYAYAIMPQYSHILSASFDCAYENTSYGTLTVGYVTDNTGYSTYVPLKTPEKSKETVTHVELSAEDLATINSNNGYIAFRYQSGSSTFYSVGIDDVVIQAIDVTNAGQWQSVDNIEGFTTPIANLTHGTNYEWQVQGINASCGDNGFTDWSESAFFTTLIDTQTIQLEAGYNWFSTNLEITLSELENALVAALPGATSIKISAQDGGTCTYNGTRWRLTGGFTWDVSQMYIIQCPSAGTVTLKGLYILPDMHPITIESGYNWIGFPLSTSMSLTDAFAGFGILNDKVSNQMGGLSTCNGSRWRTPFDLVPGQGYIYNSASSSSRTFTFPIPVGDKNGKK